MSRRLFVLLVVLIWALDWVVTYHTPREWVLPILGGALTLYYVLFLTIHSPTSQRDR